ncbi:MAG: hypothetical protein ACR2JR_07975 [Rubrobacteraceae bacterium]
MSSKLPEREGVVKPEAIAGDPYFGTGRKPSPRTMQPPLLRSKIKMHRASQKRRERMSNLPRTLAGHEIENWPEKGLPREWVTA